MSLEIAARISQLIPTDSLKEIKELLRSYSLDQRRFVISTDVRGSCLLYHAVLHCSSSVAIYFLDECGADPNSFGIEDCLKWNCLSKATSLDSKNMVVALLNGGADINAVSVADKTPVTIACSRRKVEIAKILVKRGANISIQNYEGNDALISSFDNFQLFTYLVEKGANINLVDEEGCTVLMRALKECKKKIVSFLLTREDIDLRKMNGCEEDALNLAIRFSTDKIVKKIIRRGNYRKAEMLRAYKLESCLSYLYRGPDKSNSLWQKVLTMQGLSKDTIIFHNQLPNPEFDNHVNLFKGGDRQALSYLISLCGPRHVITLRAMVTTLGFVDAPQTFLEIFEHFSTILHSLNNRDFLKIDLENVLRTYICNISPKAESLQNFFKMLREYILIFNAKYEQTMCPSLIKSYLNKFHEFSENLIVLIILLMNEYKDYTDTLHNEMKEFLPVYSKYSSFKRSLLQISFERKHMKVFQMFLLCGVDVNRSDDKGETILHYLIDHSTIARKNDLIKLIIDGGFDFSTVRSSKYCLPCRMKKEGIYYSPEKSNTLQCLAAKAICQKTVYTGFDLPPVFRSIIQRHMHIR